MQALPADVELRLQFNNYYHQAHNNLILRKYSTFNSMIKPPGGGFIILKYLQKQR